MRQIRALPIAASLLACISTWQTTAAASASSNTCPINFYSCASQGAQFDGICCPYHQACSLDTDNRPACCPARDVCTGSAPLTYATATAATSYVPNTYFSFPYILPSGIVATAALADASACDAVLQQCSQVFSLCTAGLEGGGGVSNAGSNVGSNANPDGSGGGNGDGSGGAGAAVTIVISGSTTFTRGGGGATAAANLGRAAADATTTTLATASAADVCSSLRSQACGGLPTNAAGCSSIFAGSGFSAGGNGGSRQRHLPPLGHILSVAAAAAVVTLIIL